ncbi:rNA polymerase sigma-24 subunit ECF subfamily [Odoribacter splanchnicus CAG:14]|jgi:RNA polymerase sigma-70 factor (ECF subfamily)|nr:sigma factor-like helix-turn-helix DNA-binding protein [Odoribacter splanchnicus]CDB07166.1 rNA polymerase sigma-24 subunit ECF subfamily [Odoribacter splanchnicus CAG:14]
MDGLSQREIAEQMGISEETVKKQKQIARRIIKEKIGDLWLLFFLFREKSSLCLLD